MRTVIIVLIIQAIIALATLVIDRPLDGYDLVNTDGEMIPKGAQLPPSLSEPVHYHRQVGNEARIGYFGGLQEAIAYEVNGTAVQNVFYNKIWEYRTREKYYVEIVPHVNSTLPKPRAYACGIYDGVTNRLVIFGGTDQPSNLDDYSPLNNFRDMWVFDFDTLFWTEVTPIGAYVGDRSSAGCPAKDGYMYLYGGFSFDFYSYLLQPNDIYRLKLPDTKYGVFEWEMIYGPDNSVVPVGRTQVEFGNVYGTDYVVFTGGDRITDPILFQRMTLSDIFLFNVKTNAIVILDNSTYPVPAVTQGRFTVAGPNTFIWNGGDQQGNLTAADTCVNPLLVCRLFAGPVSKTWIYKRNAESFYELNFGKKITSIRRGMMDSYVQLPQLIYGSKTMIPEDFWNSNIPRLLGKVIIVANGGYGWNGSPEGYGEIRNTNTWTIDVSAFLVD